MTNPERSGNWNHSNVLPYAHQDGYYRRTEGREGGREGGRHKTKITSVGEDTEKFEHCTVGENIKWFSCNRKQYVNFSKKNHTHTQSYHMIQHLHIHTSGKRSEELKVNSKKGTCTPLFTAAPYTIAKRWKQSKSPLRAEWKKCDIYIHGILFSLKQKGNSDACYILRTLCQVK